MTMIEFDNKVSAIIESQPHKKTLMIDEKTAYEAFGKGNFKNICTYRNLRVIISTHLPDYTILPVG